MVLPDWPGVRLFCSTRQGGVSSQPYDSLNLGDHVGDHLQHVAQNRLLLARMWGVKPVFLTQVHGTQVVEITPQTPDGTQADACWSRSPGLACTIMVADCLPVLFYSAAQGRVAAAHAGWRGLANGVLEQTLQVFGDVTERADLQVWLGPCIGPSAFEVGSEVLQAFVRADAQAQTAFSPHEAPGQFFADLPALARQRLSKAGVHQVCGNDSTQPWCTFSQIGLFYSHRRDGQSGRMAAGISLI